MAAIDPRAAPIPTQETSKLSASTLTPTTSASAALPEHCYYCFEVIAAVLQRKSVADVEVPFDAIGQEQCVYWRSSAPLDIIGARDLTPRTPAFSSSHLLAVPSLSAGISTRPLHSAKRLAA